jgi:chromodomain-helicase-DNA-binding protein 4
MDSDDDDTSQLMAAFKTKRKQTGSAPRTRTRTSTPARTSSPPLSQLRPRKLVGIFPSPVENRHEYIYYEPVDEIDAIVREFTKRGDIMYDVTMSSGTTKQVSARCSTITE